MDAVLSEKAQSCRDAGIAISINAILPSELPIETAHLCSIFSNLLDNGIQAVRKLPQPQRRLDLYADIQKGVLVVKCLNPSDKPSRKASRDPMRLHGLGLDILRQIAELYGGKLHTGFENGIFRSVLMLPLHRPDEHCASACPASVSAAG